MNLVRYTGTATISVRSVPTIILSFRYTHTRPSTYPHINGVHCTLQYCNTVTVNLYHNILVERREPWYGTESYRLEHTPLHPRDLRMRLRAHTHTHTPTRTLLNFQNQNPAQMKSNSAQNFHIKPLPHALFQYGTHQIHCWNNEYLYKCQPATPNLDTNAMLQYWAPTQIQSSNTEPLHEYILQDWTQIWSYNSSESFHKNNVVSLNLDANAFLQHLTPTKI
jgi:hypothetical protein